MQVFLHKFVTNLFAPVNKFALVISDKLYLLVEYKRLINKLF